MKYAETGFALEVDLTRGNIEKVATDPKLTALHLGGEGVAAAILWERVTPEVAPQSPANLLIFSAGLLAGTPVPGANRTCVSSIAPQSNRYVHSSFEGFFAPQLKHAGYDRIVIRGKSEDLVYLWIHDDRVEIRDASHLQGKSAQETAALLQRELKDSNIQVAAIGLAGENRACQASIEHANSSASQGAGVIMGDKKLKAIAVRGTRDIHIARPEALFALCNRLYGEIYDNPACGDLLLDENDDSWHVRQFAGDRVKGFWTRELAEEWQVRVEREEISHQWENYSQELEEVRETVVETSKLQRGTGCYNCPKDCHKSVSLPGRRHYFLKSYAGLAQSMATCEELRLNYDLLHAMQEYGLDEFAMTRLFAAVVDAYTAGLITGEDLPDFPADSIERFRYLVEKVAWRQGFGEILAARLSHALEQMGTEAERYPESVRAAGEQMDLTWIGGSFPHAPIPDRNERKAFIAGWDAAAEKFKKWFGEWEPGRQLPDEAVADIRDWNESMCCADDALGICSLLSSFRGRFGGRPPYHLYNLPQLVSLATGRELDAEGLLEICRRNRQLVREIDAGRNQNAATVLPAAIPWPGTGNREASAPAKKRGKQ